MSTAKKAFIVGKVTGLPENQVHEKFQALKTALEKTGYEVLIPVGATPEGHGKEWQENIRKDIVNMITCKEVHLLHDWTESRGGTLLRDLAVRLKDIDVVFE